MTKLIRFEGYIFNPDHIESISSEIKGWKAEGDVFYYFYVFFGYWDMNEDEQAWMRFRFDTKEKAEKAHQLLLSTFDVIKVN